MFQNQLDSLKCTLRLNIPKLKSSQVENLWRLRRLLATNVIIFDSFSSAIFIFSFGIKLFTPFLVGCCCWQPIEFSVKLAMLLKQSILSKSHIYQATRICLLILSRCNFIRVSLRSFHRIVCFVVLGSISLLPLCVCVLFLRHPVSVSALE